MTIFCPKLDRNVRILMDNITFRIVYSYGDYGLEAEFNCKCKGKHKIWDFGSYLDSSSIPYNPSQDW